MCLSHQRHNTCKALESFLVLLSVTCVYRKTYLHMVSHTPWTCLLSLLRNNFFLRKIKGRVEKISEKNIVLPQTIIKLFKWYIWQKKIDILLRINFTHCCNRLLLQFSNWVQICNKGASLSSLFIFCLSFSRPQPRHSSIWLLTPIPHLKQGRGIRPPFLMIFLWSLQ